MPDPTARHEVIVVGGGQAGLALGYYLSGHGCDFTILEAADEPAAAWRERWQSLRLFTSARYSGLPGLAFPGAPSHYPTRDEVIAYLTDYAHRFELPVRLGSRVRSLARVDGEYEVATGDRAYRARQVVVATGPFQRPRRPEFAGALDAAVGQLHSSAYRGPEDIAAGPVLVVGGGNSGFQIAAELAESHEVHLAIGIRQRPLPQRLLGRDLFWFLDTTGLIRKSTETRIGRRLAGRDPLIGSSPRALRRRGVRLHPRAVGVEGTDVTFSDGTTLAVGSVIWATGYTSDYSWIGPAVLDEHGRAVHRRGVTASPGLYFLGLTWLHTRGSALLGWVEDDAAYLADQIDDFRQGAQRHEQV
ncbi:MAG: flavin-containing monooxygenase [Candidatus Limnocylindrales bacterium]